MRNELEKTLGKVAAGKISVTDAVKIFQKTFSFSGETGEGFYIDHERVSRCGQVEVVFGGNKPPETLVKIAREMLKTGTFFATRLSPAGIKALRDEYGDEVDIDEQAGTALANPPPLKKNTETVAVVCAGSSDMFVAREALNSLRAFGFSGELVADVGVAGIHRLFSRLDVLREAPAIIAVAGMEGALPSVIGGLVRSPVIAVPTSVGYGAAFGGLAALLGMLTSCAQGITVVNIDNGFGAASAAARILSIYD